MLRTNGWVNCVTWVSLPSLSLFQPKRCTRPPLSLTSCRTQASLRVTQCVWSAVCLGLPSHRSSGRRRMNHSPTTQTESGIQPTHTHTYTQSLQRTDMLSRRFAIRCGQMNADFMCFHSASYKILAASLTFQLHEIPQMPLKHSKVEDGCGSFIQTQHKHSMSSCSPFHPYAPYKGSGSQQPKHCLRHSDFQWDHHHS